MASQPCEATGQSTIYDNGETTTKLYNMDVGSYNDNSAPASPRSASGYEQVSVPPSDMSPAAAAMAAWGVLGYPTFAFWCTAVQP